MPLNNDEKELFRAIFEQKLTPIEKKRQSELKALKVNYTLEHDKRFHLHLQGLKNFNEEILSAGAAAFEDVFRIHLQGLKNFNEEILSAGAAAFEDVFRKLRRLPDDEDIKYIQDELVSVADSNFNRFPKHYFTARGNLL